MRLRTLGMTAGVACLLAAGLADAKTLRLNIEADPAMIDPVTYSELVSGNILRNVYEGFTRLDKDGKQWRASELSGAEVAIEDMKVADLNGDGKSDQKRIVLSGFGTEDTHHNLHTLRWGFDGRLYMNQSIYTRTDTETPHGVVRLKGGASSATWPRPLAASLKVLPAASAPGSNV